MRAALLVLALLSPLAALMAFQGLVTVGLFPIAVFGPFYALARALNDDTGQARSDGARLVFVASIGAALALAPAAVLLGRASPDPVPMATFGLFLVGAATGVLAALATAPAGAPLTPDQERSWTLVQALSRSHGRGLSMLFFVAVPAALLLGLLREAPLFTASDGTLESLPQALFGSAYAGGYLVLPSGGFPMALALPLTLAPLVVGFLTPARTSRWIGVGALLVFLLTPAAVLLGLPVRTPQGLMMPLPQRPVPAVDALVALAPIGAGALLGAGIPALLHRPDTRPPAAVAWAGVGLAVAALAYGAVPTTLLALGLVVASVLLAYQGRQALLGGALLAGGLVGVLVGIAGAPTTGLGAGLLVGLVATGAATAGAVTRVLPFPEGSLRSGHTLFALVLATGAAGVVAWLAATPVGLEQVPFEAPHARSLAAVLEAGLLGNGGLLLLWGVAAGLALQWATGRGALAALGFLLGPGTVLLVLGGSLLRNAWEGHLLGRARKGVVMRGEMGYELLRAHVLVGAVLAGEALTLATVGWLGPV